MTDSLCSFQQAEPGAPGAGPVERVVLAPDGVRLSCRDWGGSGDDVLLLHGLAGHAGE
ncbi:hypothetical protein [Streptomyces sp. NPDC015130]|uniref:hypothetical protein n=1 Tax=Streptomyces sp. NPDC015130 TaxID=3364940 RepID=UPI0036FE8046